MKRSWHSTKALPLLDSIHKTRSCYTHYQSTTVIFSLTKLWALWVTIMICLWDIIPVQYWHKYCDSSPPSSLHEMESTCDTIIEDKNLGLDKSWALGKTFYYYSSKEDSNFIIINSIMPYKFLSASFNSHQRSFYSQ